MPLGPLLRLLLAGLLAGSALLALWPGGGSYTPPLRVGYKVAHADGPGDWPMFHHDPAHTGYNPDETQLQPPLRLKWSYTTAGAVSYSSPAVANGVVYVGASDGKLYALDAATDTLRWTFAPIVDGVFYPSSPAVASGVVYVGFGDGGFYALDADTGAVRWTDNIQGGGGQRALWLSSPAVADGMV